MAVSSNKLQSAHLTQMHSLSQTDALILKDAKYIAEQQEELMLEAAGGDASKVLGCLMDGPIFLRKRDYAADPTQLQILEPVKPEFMRNFWLCKTENKFPLLAVAANKLLSAHATSAAAERNWSAWGRTYTALRNRLSIETAEKLVYVKANMPKEWQS